MDFSRIIHTNTLKTYAVFVCYIVVFGVVGLLIDCIRINAPTLGSGFYYLISLQEFPLVTFIMTLAALLIILYSLKRFDSIMLEGDEYELIEDSRILKPLQRKVRRAFDDVCKRAGFMYAPRLYLIHAPYMNAFASGWKQEDSLVAVTTQLAQNLTDEELEAVLAHELSHILHGDVRLTMCVGILSNILLLVCNSVVWLFMGNNRNSGAQTAKMILLVLQFVLPLLTLWLQMFLSRSREYMADGGSAYIMHTPMPLIGALKKISQNYQNNDFSTLDSNPTRKAAYIFESSDAFSTHPSIENRIKSLLQRQ